MEVKKMAETITDEVYNDNYASAFLEVAHIVAPFCNFSEVEIAKKYTPNGVDIKPSVKGFNIINNVDVEVTTELDPNKGLQIVVNYLDNQGYIVSQTSTWYYNFNWKGIMASVSRKKD